MAPRVPRIAAAGWAAALGALFVVTYGGTLRLTALRSDVGTLAFAWEREIPFVPLLWLPYLSIDLLFLDRTDSLLFAAPLFTHFARAVLG
jgi:hypothetical protein